MYNAHASLVLPLIYRVFDAIVDLVADDNEKEFRALFGKMLTIVREKGTPLPVDEIEESDAIIPEPDITLEEAKQLFVGTGVVPG